MAVDRIVNGPDHNCQLGNPDANDSPDLGLGGSAIRSVEIRWIQE